VYEKFIEVFNRIQNIFGRPIKVFTDNGKEYVNKKMRDFIKAKGIDHRTSPPFTPEINEIAEQDNR